MITLTKDMETGIAKVDEQHKELVRQLNAVLAMGTSSVSKEETQKTIDFLGAYVVQHFKDEEGLQKQSGFEKYEWHKGQHQTFMNEFQKLRAEFVANGPSAQFTVKLNSSIINWIVKHIKSADVEFGKYYQEKHR